MTSSHFAQASSSIQELYEKLDLHVFEDSWAYEEVEWESPTVLIVAITMDMEARNGLVVKATIPRVRIEFGDYSLETGNVRPDSLVV
jgi:hypothetical protein